MEQTEKLADLHKEHADWQKSIEKYKEEIKSLNEKLGAIVSRFTPREVPAKVEHFQNQFILQRELLDIMRHDFKQYENMIEGEQKQNELASTGLIEIRHAYRTRLKEYNRILNELKEEFSSFEQAEVLSA